MVRSRRLCALVSTWPDPITTPVPRRSRPIATAAPATFSDTRRVAADELFQDGHLELLGGRLSVTCDLLVTVPTQPRMTTCRLKTCHGHHRSNPPDRGLARVGDRWTLLIVDALLEGAKRYSDLAHAVDGIAPNILAARLRKLERDGLVVARPYSHRPRRLSYELPPTAKSSPARSPSSRSGRLGSRVRTPPGTTRPAGPPSKPARGAPPANAASTRAKPTTLIGSDPVGGCHPSRDREVDRFVRRVL